MKKANLNKFEEEFKGELGLYRQVLTDDNSLTLWSEKFDQLCHSTAGAYSETKFNYLLGCEIPAKAQTSSELNILEIGFGLGIGFQVTVDYLNKNSPDTILKFYSLELDHSLIEWAKIHTKLLSENYPSLKNLKRNNKDNFSIYHSKKGSSELNIIMGDARKTIPWAIRENLLPKFQAIYHDPFSPQKNRSLWTVEWFKLLKEISSQDVIISTYSASSAIRKSMIAAGLIVKERTGFGNKRSSTQAFLSGQISEKLSQHLERSPLTPIFDDESLRKKCIIL